MFDRFARAAFFAISVSTVAACGGGDSTLTPASQNSKDGTDLTFISGAGMSSNAEIGAANLALTRSSNTDVLSFANLMITDHTQENQALAPVGLDVSFPAPTGIGPTMQAVANMLMPLAGPAFDAAYINSEITGHTNNLDDNYIPELATGLNSNVVGYANTYKPQVSSHLALAQSIKAKYGF